MNPFATVLFIVCSAVTVECCVFLPVLHGCVALLMCLFVLCVACLTVFVNCLVKQFAMCLGVVAILLLNVMDVFSVCGSALLHRPCREFVRCACDPNERQSAPSICFVCYLLI